MPKGGPGERDGQEKGPQPMKNLNDAQIETSPRRNPLMAFVEEAAVRYDPDPTHNKQVTFLAMALFDGLRPLHEYGPGERRLLNIAARLHDIGKSRVVSGDHHKLSRDMILEFNLPGLKGEDQLACSLVARYHTKALPNPSHHRHFASLNSDRQNLVEWLSGILRVADGLDCAHVGVVGRLECEIESGAIKVSLKAAGDCRRQVERARQKQELLVKKAERPIQYLCGSRSFLRYSEDGEYESIRKSAWPSQTPFFPMRKPSTHLKEMFRT
jgi:exopolyphosphatase/guanosine-5'-triphosphate,3'-diphosphate pyrophosphatase